MRVTIVQVETVTGAISGAEMGITLPHEHIFVDMRSKWSRGDEEDTLNLADKPVSIEMLGFLLHNSRLCKDNLVLDELELAATELGMFRALGGKSVVDVTTHGLSPNHRALRDLSKETELNIIAGTGYYTAATHPPDMTRRTVDRLAQELITNIQAGFPGTDVKAGIIGELGVSYPIEENEKKVLRAAAWAQRSTGVAITIHLPWRGKHALQVVRILESEGVDPRRIIIGHMDDMEDMTYDYHRAVADSSVYLEFDCFGQENYVDPESFVHPRDTERVEALNRLIDAGYIDSLLLSHDVCLKMYTRTYGGYGYDHILRTIVPMMKRIGLTETEMNHMLIDNPARAIAH